MKQQIEEIIKKNLPEKKEYSTTPLNVGKYKNRRDRKISHARVWNYNKAIDEINTSLIANEVLKVVVEITSKIDSEKIAKSQRDMDGGKYTDDYIYGYYQGMNKVKELLSEHISPIKENKN